MKLVINYDFFNAIRNVNEPLTPMKIVRNNKRYQIIAPTIFGVGYLCGMDTQFICQNFIICCGIYMTTDLTANILAKKVNGCADIYADVDSGRLKDLSTKLNDIGVKTDYDMLLKSEMYEKNYKVETSSDKLVTLSQKKYIYVPSYDFNGKEKETSILQEHDIGTNIYSLSVGEPDKQYRRVLINNRI